MLSPPKLVLTVELVEAKELTAADFGGTSDPFCTIQFQNEMQRSKTVNKNLNPVWNETFQFKMEPNSTARELVLEVFDFDKLGSNDFLGRAVVSCDALSTDAPREIWVSLTSKDERSKPTSGSAHLRLSLAKAR